MVTIILRLIMWRRPHQHHQAIHRITKYTESLIAFGGAIHLRPKGRSFPRNLVRGPNAAAIVLSLQ